MDNLKDVNIVELFHPLFPAPVQIIFQSSRNSGCGDCCKHYS
eukprot:gene17083-12222_t